MMNSTVTGMIIMITMATITITITTAIIMITITTMPANSASTMRPH